MERENKTMSWIETHVYRNKKGQRHGEFKAWYIVNGVRLRRIHCHYKDGVLHGEFTSWYATTTTTPPIALNKHLPHIHCYYKDGVLDGEYKAWVVDRQNHESKLSRHCHFKDGKLDGEIKLYYGLQKNHYFCKNDMVHGQYTEWSDGRLVKHVLYEHGENIVMLEILLRDKCILF